MLRSEVSSKAIADDLFYTTGFAKTGDPGANALYILGCDNTFDVIKDATGKSFQLAPFQRLRPEFWGGFAAYCADHTAAFTQAIAAAFASTGLGEGGVVYAENPAGYDITNLVTKNGVKILSSGAVPLRCRAKQGSCLTLFGSNSEVRGFYFQRVGSSTGNNLIAVTLGINEQGQRQVVRDNVFQGFDTTISVKTGVVWTIENNNIRDSAYYGVMVENTINPDAGDGTIRGNTLSNSGYGDSAIRYCTGGGLKITDNKILGFQRGIDMVIDDGKSTVDLLVSGNSIENQAVACVRTLHAGSGSFSTITIEGNELAGAPVGYAAESGVSNISYTGNAHNLCSTAGVTISDGADLITIDDSNVFTACTATVIDNRSGFSSDFISYQNIKTLMLSSTTAWQNIARLAVPPFRAAIIDIFIEGVLQMVGGHTRSHRLCLSRQDGNLVLTTLYCIATGPNIDFNIDLTSAPGSAILQAKLNPNSGGSGFNGTATVTGQGRLAGFYPL